MSVQKENESWEAIRQRVLDRDGHACRFCDMTETEHQEQHDQGLHAHHVLPRDAGGEDHPDNLVTVCTACHRTIESVHAAAVEQHAGSGMSDEEINQFYNKYTSLADVCLERLNDYLKRQPSVERAHSLYHQDDLTNLADGIYYTFGSPDKKSGWSIDDEYDVLYLAGYVEGVENVAHTLDAARTDGVDSVI